MHTSKDIRKTAIDTIKMGNAGLLMGFLAAFLYIPLFTLFMPIITIILYLAISFFSYPYYKITYNAACGKTLELEDILDFSGFLNFFIAKIIVFLKTLPGFLFIGIGLFLEYLTFFGNNAEWWPFVVGESEENLFFYGGACIIIIGIIFILYITLKYNLVKYYIIEGDKPLHAIKECKRNIKGNFIKYIVFILPNYLLLILGCALFTLPCILLIPYHLLSESAWYYTLRYGNDCKNTYYKTTDTILTANEKAQNMIIEEQQKRLSRINPISNVSIIEGFENLSKQQNLQPNWPPQNNGYYTNMGLQGGNGYGFNPQTNNLQQSYWPPQNNNYEQNQQTQINPKDYMDSCGLPTFNKEDDE